MSIAVTLDDLAHQFAAAHDGGPLIDSVPEDLIPADLAGVYHLQDRIIAAIGPVGGWKVMAGGTGEPMCSPITANRYYPDGATLDAKRHRLLITEVEIAVKLGQDLPTGADAATVEAAITSLHPVLEMIGDPFVAHEGVERNLKLGDLQRNGAVVVGPAFDTVIKASLGTLALALTIDGETALTTDTGADWPAIVEAIRWLATHAASRGLPLKSGDVIITGARLLQEQGAARTVEGSATGWGSVSATLTH